MYKKVIVFTLVLCFVAGALLACGGSSGSTATTAGTQAGTQLTTPAGTTTFDLSTYLPSQDYGGYDFRVLNIDQQSMWWAIIDFDAASQTGEVVNDAIYKRNRMIEDMYNIKIDETHMTPTAMSTQIKKMIQAGSDDYDLFCPESNTIGPLIGVNAFYDFNQLPNIDLTKPWWNQSVSQNFSIDGKLFYDSNDLLLTCADDLAIIMYNKNMAANMNLDSADQLYATVNAGQWTLDKMTELTKDAYLDVNGNGKPDFGDQFGMTAVTWAPKALVGACGQFIASKDSNDLPVLSCDTQQFNDVYTKVQGIFSQPNFAITEGGNLPSGKRTQDVFASDQALMCIQVLSCVRLYRDMKSDFAVLPLPKYDASQPNYYGYYLWATGIAVPSTAPDPARTGFILEALSAESHYTVIPAYYDYAIANKFMRDDGSYQMLDLLMKNPVTDISNEVYGWGGAFGTTYNNDFFKTTTNFATILAKYSSAITTDIAKTVASYQAIPG